MTKQASIAWCVLGGLVLLVAWWALVPKIWTATAAEVRGHAQAELLQPLPHPEGGTARFEAILRALDRLPDQPQRTRDARPPLDLAEPAVREVIEILRAGPIDRTGVIPAQPAHPVGSAVDANDYERYVKFLRVATGLRDATLQAANKGDWAEARRHIDASGLLLQRLFESDARLHDRRWSMSIETEVYRAALALAVRRDLPADLAERLSALLAVDRHGPASLMQVLRGEMQYVVLPRIGLRPISYYEAGTYDPLKTTELLGTRFLAMVREAGSPGAERSGDGLNRIWTLSQLTGNFWMDRPAQRIGVLKMHRLSHLAWPAQRIRLNTARNSIGRVDAQTYPDGNLVDRVRRARTQQDQAMAALAVVRFRHRAGRDPQDFGELVAAGLLRAVPMDHLQNQPLPFDLKTLFEWREVRRT